MNLVLAALLALIQPLWPEGKIPDFQPHQFAYPSQLAYADWGTRTYQPGFKIEEHYMPYLEWSEPPAREVKKDVCCIIVSGGGYWNTCDGPAFRDFGLEKRLLENGITCVWLWYRGPRPQGLPIYQSGWEDGQRAVRLVRQQAAARGFNPEKIGMMGCSAGSHLGLMLATSSQTPAYARIDEVDDIPCHINFALLNCPAYVLSDGLTEKNAQKGDGADITISDAFRFDAKTCPCLFFHGSADPYSPRGSTMVYRQLRRMKIPAELHLDADRVHGPVRGETFERALEFLRQLGMLGKLPAEKEIMRRYHDNADRASLQKEWLWPEGKTPNFQEHQNRPYIEWHIPEKLTTRAIQIVYSGGSYNYSMVNSFEVAPFRRYLNAKGMTVVTLDYRTPRPKNLPKHLTAWQDLQRAIRLVRRGAVARGLDPERIGILGSSAGGHLTLMGLTSADTPAYEPIDEVDKISCHVNWGVPIYPAYSLTDGSDRCNVTGGNADDAVLVPEFKFDAHTAPACFLHGDADGWAAMNSVKCWEKMRQMGIASDLHTYALREHCFYNCAAPGTGSYTMLDRIWEFLSKKGFNNK